MKDRAAVYPTIYDIIITLLIFMLGGTLVYLSNGNNYLNLFGGAFIGAALANLFSTLLTTRIEATIRDSLVKFDEAIDLVQYKFDGARPLDASMLRFTYQYYKTFTTGGEQWRLTLYEWDRSTGSYMAKGQSMSVDTSGHANTYSSIMISVRGCIVIIETDPRSDEPSAITILRRDVASARLFGISRLTTWKSTDAFVPIILSQQPIERWSKPEQDEHGRLAKALNSMWKENVHSEFLTRTN
jgi:hypothetical protein